MPAAPVPLYYIRQRRSIYESNLFTYLFVVLLLAKQNSQLLMPRQKINLFPFFFFSVPQTRQSLFTSAYWFIAIISWLFGVRCKAPRTVTIFSFRTNSATVVSGIFYGVVEWEIDVFIERMRMWCLASPALTYSSAVGDSNCPSIHRQILASTNFT